MESVPSLEIVNLVNHSDTEICVTNVIQNNNLSMITIDPTEDELVMLHHFAQTGWSVRMKDPKIIVLDELGPLASAASFKAYGIALGA